MPYQFASRARTRHDRQACFTRTLARHYPEVDTIGAVSAAACKPSRLRRTPWGDICRGPNVAETRLQLPSGLPTTYPKPLEPWCRTIATMLSATRQGRSIPADSHYGPVLKLEVAFGAHRDTLTTATAACRVSPSFRLRFPDALNAGANSFRPVSNAACRRPSHSRAGRRRRRSVGRRMANAVERVYCCERASLPRSGRGVRRLRSGRQVTATPPSARSLASSRRGCRWL